MRLEFNIVVIDDDLSDPDEKEAVDELIDFVESHVAKKGFKPKFHPFSSVEDYLKEMPADTGDRIDLFLSDNNLGSGEQGITFYISLSNTGIHDFVLYTRDSQVSIVTALVEKLQASENPNLFSRFTFVHRESDNSWLESIEDVLDHILSKREEINNLRGLYAQEMSKVENHLRNKLQAGPSASLEALIDKAFETKKIQRDLRKKLHHQRCRRNGIIHNDEKFCDAEKKWFVTYEEYGGRRRVIKVYEKDFLKIRNELAEVVAEVMNL